MVRTGKNFTFEGKNAVKIGTVELYEGEILREAFGKGKHYILTRTCAYYILGKKAQAGQFFTPYHVSHLMASCNFDTEKMKLEIAEDPDRVITIAEPTCGAGGLIVAPMEVLKDAGINYAWNTFVDCGDIDSRCVHMTYLTLSLLGVPAVVRRGDALALDYSETWYTPAYIFAWPHFKKQLHGGKYPATPTVQEYVKKEPSIETAQAIKQSATVPEPMIEKDGQLSLINLFNM